MADFKLLHGISIHALREEGDCHEKLVCRNLAQFLSTPSARRATLSFVWKTRCKMYFYPRPPRGGRPHQSGSPSLCSTFLSTPSARRATKVDVADFKLLHGISIHALREEGDCHEKLVCRNLAQFLSTPSARRATLSFVWKTRCKMYFYPRPPRGGRPHQSGSPSLCSTFLSTPSARRATYCPECQKAAKVISIHALREEGDPCLRM